MPSDASKKKPSSADYRPPAPYADDQNLSNLDRDLVINLELNETEFARYKKLEPYTKAGIIPLLDERKHFNKYVKDYLQEAIDQQSGPIMQLLFPSEHSLKYALQKVDETEDKINKKIEDESQYVFDKTTTKRNRLESLLTTAYVYLGALDAKIAKTGRSALKAHALQHAAQKRANLDLIIQELHTQLDTAEYSIHNRALFRIDDNELSSFISKLKIIGIGGFASKANKYQPTFFNINIFNSIYEKLAPNQVPDESENDTPDFKRPKKR